MTGGLSCDASLSARRAWIEIIDDLEPSSTRKVALRKESVDRNCEGVSLLRKITVALRKESVDRNSEIDTRGSEKMVALRKESVDRNSFGLFGADTLSCRSPQGERG